MYRRAALIIALGLAGCGGGGGSPSAGPPPPPPTSVTQSQAIGTAGGALSATLNGTTVTLTVPAGGLSATGTLGLTVYANSVAPRALHAAQRSVRSVGADAVLVTEFSVSLSGATLLKPLAASIGTGAAPAGSVFRLAGFGTSIDDVDTVTWSGGTASTDPNLAYPRMSLAAAGGTLYAFYTEPSGEASAAPTPQIAVSTTASLPVGMFGSAPFTASESSPNGFPYLDTAFAFSLDNISLGSVDPNSGAFTAGAVDGAGNVIATDTTSGRGNPSGKTAVSVTSQRPGNQGDSFTYSGTLTSTTQLLTRNPTQVQTDAASVALASTVNGFTPVAGGGQSAVHSTETDTYPLLTVKTTTDSAYVYAPSGTQANVSIKSSNATDSNGVNYVTNYGTGNGLLDVLPESTGSFGPNNAALTYAETDQAGFARTRTVAATGAYSEQGHDALGDVQTITTNADFSAAYDARQYSGLRFTMGAPAGSPQRIAMAIFNRAGTQVASFSIVPWFPAGITQPSTETDTDAGTTTYPAACNVPAKYGTSGNKIVQTITRVDPALGNSEVQTTTTYMAPRVGAVCIQLSDNVQTFYDLTGQNGFSALIGGGTNPLEQVTLNETLTLQSASTESGTHTSSTQRGVSAVPNTAFAPVAFARARFEHAVREKTNWMRRQTFTSGFLSGVHQL